MTRIGGNALAAAAVPFHFKMVALAVLYARGLHFALPDITAVKSPDLELRRPFPSAEIAHQPHGDGIGRPFAEHPAVFRAVQPEIMVSVGPLRKLRAPGQFLRPKKRLAAASFDHVAVRLEISVVQQ